MPINLKCLSESSGVKALVLGLLFVQHFSFLSADGIAARSTIAEGVRPYPCVFTSKTHVSAPLRAVRISGITRSNSAVSLIDARGLSGSHSRHILTGISYRWGLAQALLVPSKENKRRDIRALFQRRGPFCLCLISLREKWKEGQPISLHGPNR